MTELGRSGFSGLESASANVRDPSPPIRSSPRYMLLPGGFVGYSVGRRMAGEGHQ